MPKYEGGLGVKDLNLLIWTCNQSGIGVSLMTNIHYGMSFCVADMEGWAEVMKREWARESEWEERKRARRTCNRGKNNEHLDRRGKGESEKDNGKYSSPFFKKLVLVNYITIYLNLSIFLSNNSTN